MVETRQLCIITSSSHIMVNQNYRTKEKCIKHYI